MNVNVPLINGQSYDWVDIEFIILGKLVTGITGVKYGSKQEKKDAYGSGVYPIQRGRGHIESEASIELYLEEVAELRKLVSTHNLVDIPAFDIIVSYTPDISIGKIMVDTIKNCEFTTNGNIDLKENEANIKVELPLITSHVVYGVPAL